MQLPGPLGEWCLDSVERREVAFTLGDSVQLAEVWSLLLHF
jgi:hypothetical protein